MSILSRIIFDALWKEWKFDMKRQKARKYKLLNYCWSSYGDIVDPGYGDIVDPGYGDIVDPGYGDIVDPGYGDIVVPANVSSPCSSHTRKKCYENKDR